MTFTKKLLWTALTAGLVVAAYLVMRPAPSHHINRAGFEKIKKGMMLPEVEAILGAAAGDYTTRPTTSECDGWYGPGEKDWAGDEGVISVWFDVQGRIKDKSFAPATPRTGVTGWQRIQIWLGLMEKTERIILPGPY